MPPLKRKANRCVRGFLLLTMMRVCVGCSEKRSAPPDYHSDAVGTAADALQKLRESDYDALLMDVRMPGMSGLELLKEVKDSHPQVKVVLISGYSSSDVESQAEQCQADGFLGKPLMMADIEKLLNNLL